jgi:hypothetical protein
MTLLYKNEWEIVLGLVASAIVFAVALWLVFRKRPTAEEIEYARRYFLVQSGRLVDGMLLDIFDVAGDAGEPRSMLLFSYRIGGVDYECSQDVTYMQTIVDPTTIRVGFPCSVRYQPGNPQNSIVVAEEWSGLREGLPLLPTYEDPDPLDYGRRRPGRGLRE